VTASICTGSTTDVDAPPVVRGSIHASVDGIRADLIDVITRTHPRAGLTRVIAVDGLSGSGKSTVARTIADALTAPTINLDDIYGGWTGLAGVSAQLREWVIEPLIGGRDPRWRRFDWARQRYGEWVTTPRARNLVIEGCGAGGLAIADQISVLIWVEASYEERLARLRARADWPWYAPHEAAWRRQEVTLLERERTPSRADVIVTNDGRATLRKREASD
jgi:cytidylate kinase